MNIKGAALLTGFVALLGFGGAAYAGKVELTTYYPAPVGEYNTLKAKRLTTGDNLPDEDGDILLKARAGDPGTWPATPANIGQFAYSAQDDALYHSNGSAWLPAGGGSTVAVITFACAWSGLTYSFVGSCVPPACPVDWTSEPVYNEPVSLGSDGSSLRVVGRSVRVCIK